MFQNIFHNLLPQTVQRSASDRAWWFRYVFFPDLRLLLRQLVATVPDHQRPEKLQKHLTKYSKRSDAQRCKYVPELLPQLVRVTRADVEHAREGERVAAVSVLSTKDLHG